MCRCLCLDINLEYLGKHIISANGNLSKMRDDMTDALSSINLYNGIVTAIHVQRGGNSVFRLNSKTSCKHVPKEKNDANIWIPRE
jgi:hypothetical protein